MKTSIIVVALLLSGLSSIQAQYQVVENGADYRVWQKTTYEGGNTLLYNYQNGVDLNGAISFSLFTTNNYVNTTLPNLQLNITAGVPAYQA
jgi:hypothetical protein